MFDIHVHAGAPDGLLPAEAMALARAAGYRMVTLLARCDVCALSVVLPPLVRACREAALYGGGEALPGVELAYIPPPLLAEAVQTARELGARLVAVHGELPGQSVPEGTTLAAIEAGVDVVLHPGLITPEEAALAAERQVSLELSLCFRQAVYNGHVAALARSAGAPLLTGSNARRPEDFVPLGLRSAMLRGAGLSREETDRVDAWSLAVISRLLRGKRGGA